MSDASSPDAAAVPAPIEDAAAAAHAAAAPASAKITEIVPERPKPVPPTMGGFLEKLKHRPSSLSSWNKRYFRINPTTETFEYFNSYEDSRPKTAKDKKEPNRTFHLSADMTVEAVDNVTFHVIFHGSKGNTPVVFLLRAPTKKEMGNWVDAFNTYFAELKEYETWMALNTPTGTPRVEEHEGFLLKLKHEPNAFGSWNTRYFRTKPEEGVLEYYSGMPKTTGPIEKRSKPSKVLHLCNVITARPLDEWTFQLVFAKESNGNRPTNSYVSAATANFGGKVRHTGPVAGSEIDFILVLRAHQMSDAKDWLEVFMQYLQKRKLFEEFLAHRAANPDDEHPMRPSVAATDVPDWLKGGAASAEAHAASAGAVPMATVLEEDEK